MSIRENGGSGASCAGRVPCGVGRATATADPDGGSGQPAWRAGELPGAQEAITVFRELDFRCLCKALLYARTESSTQGSDGRSSSNRFLEACACVMHRMTVACPPQLYHARSGALLDAGAGPRYSYPWNVGTDSAIHGARTTRRRDPQTTSRHAIQTLSRREQDAGVRVCPVCRDARDQRARARRRRGGERSRMDNAFATCCTSLARAAHNAARRLALRAAAHSQAVRRQRGSAARTRSPSRG